MSRLSAHFLITAASSRHFDVHGAGELLEVYKRALPLSEYSSMVEELCSGLLVLRFSPFPQPSTHVFYCLSKQCWSITCSLWNMHGTGLHGRRIAMRCVIEIESS